MDDVRLIEQDDRFYCPLCGRESGSPGRLCDECRSEDPGDYVVDDDGPCMCGLSASEHVYPKVDHGFTPKAEAVFTHCNDCGRKLHTPEEDQIGLCALCANL